MDSSWKKFEREISRILGGRRFWANSGEAFDCETDTFLVQCKHVRVLSLAALSELALAADRAAQPKAKLGLVAVKLSGRRGPTAAPILFVMTASTFADLHGTAGADAAPPAS